jgi:exosortase
VVVLSTIALFSQDLVTIFSDALQSESFSHLLAVPFIFVYLVYRKRKMLRAVIPNENKSEPKEIRHLPLICGILLSTTSVLLYWYGSYTFTPIEYHMFALPIFAAGVILILFNPQTLRQLAFPIAFLMFLMPPPSEILYTLGATLSTISTEASNALANAFGVQSTIISEYGNPTIVITRPDGASMEFTVDIACSGIYSLVGFLIFAVFIAYIIRDKTWKKLAIILSGIPLIYFLNIIRITTILILGYYYGEELALQTFHLLGGWMLIFLGTLLLLTISERIFKTQIFAGVKPNCPQCRQTSQENFCAECGKILNPSKIPIKKSDVAKTAAIALTVILLTMIQTPVFALTQTSPIVIVNTPSGQQASTNILPQIPGYKLYFAYRDAEFEQKAKQDMSLVYIYSPSNQSKEPIWVAIEIASTRSSLHRWETCLITWPLSKGCQPKVTQMELDDIKLNENPPIIGRYFAFTYIATNETQAVLYWYETATFTINKTSQQKNAKISVIAYPDSPEDLPNVKIQLTTIAETIANYWQPIKTWSQITMILSQNGLTLTTISIAILSAIILLYILEVQKYVKANTNAYQKLSEINRQMVEMVKETEKKHIATLSNTAATYREKTGKQITKTQLLKRLSEIEKTGIIKRVIANQSDEPIITWKTQIRSNNKRESQHAQKQN